MRRRSAPKQKRTPRQSISKSLLASRSQYWRTLSPAQQATWQAQVGNYSRVNSLGVLYDILAHPLQVYTNINAQLNNDPPINTGSAPVVYPMFEIADVGMIVGIQSLEANYEDLDNPPSNIIPPGFSVKVYFTAILSDGINNPPREDYKLVTVLPAGFNTSLHNYWNDYITAYGSAIYSPNKIICGAMVATSLTNYIDGDVFSTQCFGVLA